DNAIEPFSDLITGVPSLKVNNSYVKGFYQATDSVLAKIKEATSLKSLADMIAKLENLVLPPNCYTSLPIFIGNDIKNISIDLKSRADSLGLSDYSTSLTIPPFQQKIWGVSSGIFVTGLKNNSFGIKTFTQPRTGGGIDTLYNLVSDENGSMQ